MRENITRTKKSHRRSVPGEVILPSMLLSATNLVRRRKKGGGGVAMAAAGGGWKVGVLEINEALE